MERTRPKSQLDSARTIDEDVAGFEIPMDQVGRVDVLESLEYLIDDKLDMDRLQDRGLDFDGIGQIAFRQIKRSIKIPPVRRKRNAFDGDDILMTKLL